MIEKVNYYFELFISLCGYNGSDDSTYIGWMIVLLSTAVVVYAFYVAISRAIWPGEQSRSHIKYRVFDDSEAEEVDRAY